MNGSFLNEKFQIFVILRLYVFAETATNCCYVSFILLATLEASIVSRVLLQTYESFDHLFFIFLHRNICYSYYLSIFAKVERL